jgi:hypothetical protein
MTDTKAANVLEKKDSEVGPGEYEDVFIIPPEDERAIVRRIDLCLLPFMVDTPQPDADAAVCLLVGR